MDHFVISRDAAAAGLANAKTFLSAVEEYLSRAAPEALAINTNIDRDYTDGNDDDGGAQ